MAEHSTIQWTDATWNPITGCSLVSAGCTNCYAMRLAGTRLQHHPSRAGLTRETSGGPVWTGEVRLNEEWLTQPLRWKRPRMIFVCAHSDLFHPNVPDEWIDRIFAVMALCPQHQFQLLTKRPERMARWFGISEIQGDVADEAGYLRGRDAADRVAAALWPLPNVWLGTSVEHQAAADERIPHLLRTPAAVRFLSVEPMLGPVCLSYFPHTDDCEWRQGRECDCRGRFSYPDVAGDWVNIDEWCDWCIIGAESGPHRRPCDLAWVQSLVEQCAAAGVPCFVKQIPRPDGTISHDPDDPQWPWPDWARRREFPEAPHA